MTSLLLTLVMLLSLVPAMGVTASAAEWTTVNTYKELQDAVKAKEEYIKLGQDIDTTNFHSTGSGLEVEDWLTFENQTCTLDLNGKTLTLMTRLLTMGVFLRVYKGSNLTIKDSSSANTGAITGAFKNYIASDAGCCLFHVHGGSSLTLENGSFTVTSEPHESNADTVRAMDSNITIKEGVTISHPGKFYPEHSYKDLDGNSYALRTDGKCKVVIDGGVFDGHVKLSGYQDTNGSIQINKGTFKKDVQVLYTAEENNSNPAVTVNGGTFEGNVYLQYWPWKTSLYMPYRLNGGTFKGTVDLYADDGIFEKDKPTGNPNIALGLDKCFGYSAVVTPDGTFTGPNAYTAVLEKLTTPNYKYYEMWLKGTASNPVRIIPNAWGMKSVTLDGTEINYAKDWKGAVEKMDNSTAHTLTFEWYPLAKALKDAGYSYDAKCEHYISGSTEVQQTDTIAADKTSHTVTIPAGADPKVYSFDLKLNLKKDGSFVGIMHNEHIVKLVVNQAAPVEPVPTLAGKVYYTSGIVYGSRISTGTGDLPHGLDSSKLLYQWQHSTDGGTTWTNIEGATSGSYTPVEADMGENVRIRVKVTAEGYLGEIIGAALKVSKADNNKYPEVIQLEAVQDEAGNYIGFKITNFNSDCEYVYSKDSTPDWSKNKITSDTVTDLESDKTYYVFARFEATDTHTAGSIVSKNSIRLYGYVPLQYVSLEGYDSGNTIYIKEGESVELKVSADPSNANFWNAITFKDDSNTTQSHITIENPEIAASGENAASFPNGHTITIKGVSKGSATLSASYPSSPPSAYGTWSVVVYDDSTVANALRLKNVYTYEDITLSVNDEAELPTDLPTLLPENSGYHLEWRIVKTGVGTGGALYLTSDDNITLENDKIIKPEAAHTESARTRLELVAVKDGSTEYKTLPKTSLFYVTVTAAPVIELTGLTVAPAKVNLELNATYQLSAVKEPVNAAGSLTWASDKPEVAEVDTTGKVTAKAQGTAIITVTCGTKSASCTVTVGHTHDTNAQPWVYMDPGTHIKTCTAGDDFKVEAHDFNAWTPNSDDTTHSRTCSKCKKSGETANYTETANHNWQWVVDAAATPNAAGKQHEECVDCHAKRSENTPIPMLTSIMVEHLTVAKPVKDAAATAPTTTDSTYTVANTEWMAADGTPLAIGGKFQPGTVYTVKITLETAGAGVFSVKSTYNTIEGKTATVSPNLTGDNHADSVELTYTFDKTAGGYHPGTGTGATTYPITVKSAKNGDVTASHKTASKGTAVTLTVDPDKGYVLDTLTVLDGKDKEIKLTEKNGKYTFTMPDSKVTVAATFKASAPTGKNPFIDVPAGSYYEDAVVWAVEKGITSGTSTVTFDPNGNCTRAQAVTFLWRAAGSPAPKTKVMPFTDVPSGSYYYDAVLWAMEQGITKGTSDTAFSPNTSCTRAQIVTFLWRANGSPAVSGNSAFTDVASDAYYAAAVAWAEKNGVTGGIGNGLFGSGNNCTRAQIVTFLYRAMK